MRVVLPWRRPGVTAMSCEPCHCAVGGALSLSPCALESLLDDGEPLPAGGSDEDADGDVEDLLDEPDEPGVLFFIKGVDDDAASAEYCAITRPASLVTDADVAVCAMVSWERSLAGFSPF